MEFYFVIFIILLFSSLLEIFSVDRRSNILLFIIFSFALFSLSFLRWETGTDWDSYTDFFNTSNQFFADGEYEWGFSRINEIIKILFNNFTFLLFIIGIIVFAFQSKAILNLSPYPITSLLVLWSVSFGNIFFVRQTVATAILLYSIRFVQERKFWKFILMIGIAMLFHRSSIIFIFVWPLYSLKIKSSTMIFYIVLSVFVSVLVSRVVEGLGSIMGGVIQQKLDFYLSDNENTMGSDATLAQIIFKGFANKIFIFGISIWMLKRIELRNLKFRGYLNIYWAGVILYFSTISVSVALVRLSVPYDIIMIVIIPIIIKEVNSVSMRLFVLFIFSLYLTARLYIAITASYYHLYVPFKTVFGVIF